MVLHAFSFIMSPFHLPFLFSLSLSSPFPLLFISLFLVARGDVCPPLPPVLFNTKSTLPHSLHRMFQLIHHHPQSHRRQEEWRWLAYCCQSELGNSKMSDLLTGWTGHVYNYNHSETSRKCPSFQVLTSPRTRHYLCINCSPLIQCVC